MSLYNGCVAIYQNTVEILTILFALSCCKTDILIQSISLNQLLEYRQIELHCSNFNLNIQYLIEFTESVFKARILHISYHLKSEIGQQIVIYFK